MKIRIAAAAALALAAGLTLSACTSPADAGGMGGMNHDMKPSASAAATNNDADVMFAVMMIPHHQQAVQMGDIMTSKTDADPKVVQLAQKIKAAQAPEIEQMRGWLKKWGADEHMSMNHPMEGMLSDAEIQALTNATGTEASKLYLTGMIGHHEGAIGMAETEIAQGRDPEAIALAKAIVAAQKGEIDQMKQMLGQ